MKLLVLAQTPPPLHGQSVMVQSLLAGLPRHGIEVQHVNLSLSRDTADVGRWRIGKITKTLDAAVRAVFARFRHDCDTLYYVPAPPKRGALYRDWAILFLCRPFFRRTVLHWHAAGLAEWLESRGTFAERLVSRVLLGRVDLAIVLADGLRTDGEKLRARRIAVVPNGIIDPGRAPPVDATSAAFRVLFLGLCSEAKGVFAAVTATIAANERESGSPSQPHFVLTVAGPFPDQATEARFHALAAAHPAAIRHAGIVDVAEKNRLFAECHCLCLPTRYEAEALPLVLLEALAHDRPIVATRWRGVPNIVSPDVGRLVEVDDDSALVAALQDVCARPPPPGICRTRFLEHYTVDQHLANLASALTHTRCE